MIRAIGFDAYGTLLQKEWSVSWPFTELFRRLQKDPNFSVNARSYAIDMCVRNFRNVREICDHYNVRLSGEEVQKYTALIREDLARVRSIPGTLEMLDFIRAQKIKTFLISNLSYPYKVPLVQLGITDRMDATLYSFSEGRMKPDPTLFRTASRLLQVDPSEALFIGDSLKNDIEASLRVGMTGMSIAIFRERFHEILSSNSKHS